MRVAILSCGAVVIKEQDQEWLFGAPYGVDASLKEAGIDVPKFVFLTALRSPGYTKLGGNIVSFKEKPLSMNGLSATPIKHKHGTDFFIEADGAKILFSERGDVAAKDLEDYNLCIIKNKHRGDEWDDHIITWPWPDAEYSVADGQIAQVDAVLKVWSSMSDVPSNLKVIEGANLSLDQANYIARVAKAAGEKGKENWAIAVEQFKNEYKKDGDKWAKKDTESSESEESEPEKREKQAKVSKDDADYRPSDGDTSCGNCAYFDGTGACSRVEGTIDPNYVSNIYAPEDEMRGIVGNEVSRQATAAMKEVTEEGPVVVPTTLKELAPDIPDTIDGNFTTVYKSEDGKWHWASITSSSIWDGHGEYVTPQAMEWAINVAKVIGAGPLRFKHAPGLDGGTCTRQATAGGLWFEKGDFDDTDIGQAMRRALQNDPTWKISPGLMFTPKDLVGGIYQRVMAFERSMTKEPANRTTAILATDGGQIEMAVKQLTEDELAQVAKDLELEVGYVTKLHQQALTNGGNQPVGLKEFKEFVEKESKSKKDEDYEEEEEMSDEEKMKKTKEIVAGLEPEARKILEEALKETEAPEVRLQAEVTQLKETLKEQGERMDQMLTLMTGALSGRSKEKEGTQDALAELLGNLPRKQAQFVSKELGTEPDEADEEVMALLKEIREEVSASQANPFGQGGRIYDTFTSQRLNPSQRGN